MKHRLNDESKDFIAEKVKFNTELIKILSLSLLATISALLSLLYNWQKFNGRNFVFGF